MIKSAESGLGSQKGLDSNSCCTSHVFFDLTDFPFLSEPWFLCMENKVTINISLMGSVLHIIYGHE